MAVKYDDIYNEEYNKAIGNSVKKLEESQEAAEKARRTAHEATTNKLQQNHSNAMKQAYISKMKEQKAAPSILARQGLNGGYSETNQASITRNYHNNRLAADLNLQNSLKDADVQLDSDIASLKSTYADAINSAKQNAISLALSAAAQRFNAQQAAGGGVGGSPYTSPPDLDNGKETLPINTGTVTGTGSTIKQMQSDVDAPVSYYTTVIENGVLYRLGKNANGRTITKEAVRSGAGAQGQLNR